MKLWSKFLVMGIALTAVFALSGASAFAAVTGDPVAGKKSYKSKCGSCHKLTFAGAKSGSFSDLNKNKKSEAAVLAAIKTPPTGMPTVAGTDEELQNIAAAVVVGAQQAKALAKCKKKKGKKKKDCEKAAKKKGIPKKGAAGKPIAKSAGCLGCHMINGKGGKSASNLSEKSMSASKVKSTVLAGLGAAMPATTTLTDTELNNLGDFVAEASKIGKKRKKCKGKSKKKCLKKNPWI